MGAVSGGWLKDGWAQDADVVAHAAVMVDFKALGKDSGTPKVWFVQKENVVRFGRTGRKA